MIKKTMIKNNYMIKMHNFMISSWYNIFMHLNSNFIHRSMCILSVLVLTLGLFLLSILIIFVLKSY